MFNNSKYITRGVSERTEVVHQLLMWQMIEEIPVEKDYLQIFTLECKDGVLTITHSQEQPHYKKVHTFTCKKTVKTEKIYVIDSGEYSTMFLAEEY